MKCEAGIKDIEIRAAVGIHIQMKAILNLIF